MKILFLAKHKPFAEDAAIELAGIKFSVDTSADKESERTNAEDYNIGRGGARKSFDRFNQNPQPIRNCRDIRLAAA